MLYEYQCAKCSKKVELYRSIKEYKKIEDCAFCDGKMNQIISSKIQFIGSRNEFPEYNPAFGKVIKGRSHRKEEAKIRGWEKVGNEKNQTLEKEASKIREHNYQERWAE